MVSTLNCYISYKTITRPGVRKTVTSTFQLKTHLKKNKNKSFTIKIYEQASNLKLIFTSSRRKSV